MPPLTEFMSADSRAYFDKVVALLNELGLRPKITPRLVRGLDYYNNTVWEIAHPALGAQDALAGGGRYSIQMGKKPLEGVGFAMGLERVIMALNAVDALVETLSESVLLWFVSMGAKALDANFILEQELRNRGVACGMDMTGRSMKAQMRAANRANARFVVICGDDEVAKRVLLLKDMGSGEQCEIDKETLIERILQEKG
jgi:histidyl-tRNA synthetase